MKFLLVFLQIVLVTNTYRITEEMNEMLQERCGRRAYERKVQNGQPARLGQFPWVATLYIKRDNGGLFLGPATIISNRHLFAFNIVRQNGSNYYLASDVPIHGTTCEGDHLVLPDDILSKFDIDFEYLTPVRTEREFHNTIGKITVVNGCKSVGSSNLFILELREELKFNKYRRPACVSNSPKNWFEVEQFPMYGINATGILETAQFSPVKCEVKEPLVCAKSIVPNQGLCAGDFGGSAAPYIDNKATVIGVFVKGNINCAVDPKNVENYKFVNLGYMRQDICDVTGVCAPPPPEEVTKSVTTTTEEPIVGGITGKALDLNSTTRAPQESTDQNPSTLFTDVYHPPTNVSSSDLESNSMELNSTDTDTIEAETYPRMSLNPDFQAVETIVAESFEKLKLNGTRADAQIITEAVVEKVIEKLIFALQKEQVDNKGKEVHVHLHFDK